MTPSDGGKSQFWANQVIQVFETLKRENPALLEGAKPLALGSHGMVVDHGDDTVSKFFLGGKNPDEVKKIHADETHVLRMVGGAEFGGAATPVISSEAKLQEGGTAFAVYRMTKMPGAEIKWDAFPSEADMTRHFESVGRVLAGFHTQATALENVTPPVKGIAFGASVAQVPALDAATNKALATCDAYLKKNMQPGVNHGDFHPNNFKVNAAYEVTGLFDLSFSGRAKNYLVDFAMIPEAGMPHAIAAYEKNGGRPVDPVMLAMTQISHDAASINWQMKNPGRGPEALKNAIDSLSYNLDKVKDITGITPAPKLAETTYDRSKPTVAPAPKQG